MSLGILMLVGGAVALFQRNVIGLTSILRDDLNAQQELRKTLKDFAPEARAAAPSASGAYALVTVATSTFTFYSDYDGDGTVDRLRYFLSGTTLKKGILKPTGNPPVYTPANEKVSDVVRNVQTGGKAIFEYYDSSYDGDGAPLADPVNVLNVRLVRLILSTDRDTRVAPEAITASTQASLRNLKDNL